MGGSIYRGILRDWVAAARSIGAEVISPVHGGPSGFTVESREYLDFVGRGVVERAHKLGMRIVPWTVG